MRRLMITALLVVLVGSACSSSGATPQPGTFAGSGADGFGITLIVGADLKMPELSAKFSCGPIGREETITFTPPYDLDAGSFDLEFSTWQLKGKFKGDGAEVNGSWESGSCSGDWSGRRIGA